MKQLSEERIDDLLKLKFGKLVTDPGNNAFVSNKTLSKIFRISEHRITYIIRKRFEMNKQKNLPFVKKLGKPDKGIIPYQNFKGRQRFGIKFLKKHHIEWITDS